MVVGYDNKMFQKRGRLSWERAQSSDGCRGMEDIAMLVFYLPIIILEAMFDAREAESKPIAIE
jgi:hypothetical protein